MPNPRAILFDVFGTIVDWRSSLIAELTEFGRTHTIQADWATLIDDWRGAYKPSMDRVRRGELPWTKLDDLHRASLDTLLAQHGIEGVTEADRHYLAHAWHRLHAWPDAVEGTRRLHAHAITAPLSNGNVSLLIDLARFNALPWDMVFGSDVTLHYKPDPETYLTACHMLSLAPREVMLCAAHNDDLAAAQSLGLQTAFIPRPTEYGPRQVRDTQATGEWTHVLTSITDLADRLAS